MTTSSPQMASLLKDLQRFIAKPNPCWILKPKAGCRKLSLSESKFGGLPYPGELDDWPECPTCRIPLNFILQLHQQQFPQMWFPRGKNLFQIFRCPDAYCEGCGKDADRFMLSLFIKTVSGNWKAVEQPIVNLEARCRWPEHPFGEHVFDVEQMSDYPSQYPGRLAWWGSSWERFQDKYTSDDMEVDAWFYNGEFWSLIENQTGIKISGLPSWQQRGKPPTCRCGRVKTFIFQLASFYDPQTKANIGIGDGGNIYYFVCRRCGLSSLESGWDCG